MPENREGEPVSQGLGLGTSSQRLSGHGHKHNVPGTSGRGGRCLAGARGAAESSSPPSPPLPQEPWPGPLDPRLWPGPCIERLHVRLWLAPDQALARSSTFSISSWLQEPRLGSSELLLWPDPCISTPMSGYGAHRVVRLCCLQPAALLFFRRPVSAAQHVCGTHSPSATHAPAKTQSSLGTLGLADAASGPAFNTALHSSSSWD